MCCARICPYHRTTQWGLPAKQRPQAKWRKPIQNSQRKLLQHNRCHTSNLRFMFTKNCPGTGWGCQFHFTWTTPWAETHLKSWQSNVFCHESLTYYSVWVFTAVARQELGGLTYLFAASSPMGEIQYRIITIGLNLRGTFTSLQSIISQRWLDFSHVRTNPYKTH